MYLPIAEIDFASVGAQIVSGILAIGAVGTFVAKYVSRATKYARLAKAAVIAFSDLVDSLEDGKLTPEEITKLTQDAAAFKAQLNTTQPQSATPVP